MGSTPNLFAAGRCISAAGDAWDVTRLSRPVRPLGRRPAIMAALLLAHTESWMHSSCARAASFTMGLSLDLSLTSTKGRKTGMNIFVCIKQVPFDQQGGSRRKDRGAEARRCGKQNEPYDLLCWRRRCGSLKNTAAKLRWEPWDRRSTGRGTGSLHDGRGRRSYVFSDRRLGGADVLATSYTLSQAIRSVGDFDLILCGRQTTDGDTAQVGPAIAEHLGIPHAAWVDAWKRWGTG